MKIFQKKVGEKFGRFKMFVVTLQNNRLAKLICELFYRFFESKKAGGDNQDH